MRRLGTNFFPWVREAYENLPLPRTTPQWHGNDKPSSRRLLPAPTRVTISVGVRYHNESGELRRRAWQRKTYPRSGPGTR
jgi:hypothetical protein